MNAMMLGYVLVLSLAGIIICWMVQSYMVKSEPTEDTIFTKKKKVHYNIWYLLYQRLKSVPLLKRYVFQLRKQFELFLPGDEKAIVLMTVKVIIIVLSAMLVLSVFLIVLRPSLYYVLCGVAIIFVLNDQIIQSMVGKNTLRLLQELDEFSELVQLNFLQSRMIDEALQDSMLGKLKMIELHGRQILNILRADDLEGALQRYNKSITNQYLKEFMCICVTTFVYGDTETQEKSRFLESLKNLKKRIGGELDRLEDEKFKYAFLPVLSISPIFLLEIIRNWAINTIPELEPYYYGYYGVIVIVLGFVVSCACYVLINRLRMGGLADLGEHAILKRIAFFVPIKKLLKQYFNRNYGKKLQYNKILKQTGSRLTAETLFVKRLLFAAVAFVLMITTSLGMHYSTRKRITTQITGMGSTSSAASETDAVIMMLMVRGYTDKYLNYDVREAYNEVNSLDDTQNSKEVTTETLKQFWKEVLLEDFDKGGCAISDEAALSVIYQYNKEHMTSTKLYTAYLGTDDSEWDSVEPAMLQDAKNQLAKLQKIASEPRALELNILNESVADDVIERVSSYQNAYFKWYEILLACIISVIAFQIPYRWVLYTMRDSQRLMEDEIMQYQALILILMPIKSMSAEIIMDWILMVANIFRPSIHKCTIELPVDEMKAFDDLLQAEPYAPLQDLVGKMKMCDKVGVQKAFYNIEVTNNNFAEHRKHREARRSVVNSELAGLLLFVPFTTILVMYLIVPFMIESFGQLFTTMQQMGSM